MRRLFSVGEVSVLTTEHSERQESSICPMVGSRNKEWMFVHIRFCNQQMQSLRTNCLFIVMVYKMEQLQLYTTLSEICPQMVFI